MNVLILTDKLVMGGAESYFCKLENHLRHREMTFYYAAGSGDLNKNIQHANHFTELSRTNHLKNIWSLASIINKKEICIVHANSLRMVLYCLILKTISSKKFSIIYTKHNVTILEKRMPNVFKYLLNKHVKRIITVCGHEAQNIRNLGVKREKIITIYNGVDLQQFEFKPKAKGTVFNIGILARLSVEKNHGLVIEIADFLKNREKFQFFIAGEGPEKQRIERKIKEIGLSNITMLGGIKTPESFIRKMDVLLMTSFREVFPMVIIEAMATGTPVLSIDTGGIKEAVMDNQTGILVNSYDAKEFCRKVDILESDEQARLNLVHCARKKVEEDFSLERMIHKTLEVYLDGKPSWEGSNGEETT